MKSQNSTRRKLLWLSALSMTLLQASATMAQSKLGATFDEIVAGAKQEGKLVAWIVLPRMPETHKALIDAFNARFGLNTQLEWVPNSPVASNTRAIAEMASGKVGVDIIGGGAIEEVSAAVRGNLIKPYPWTAVFGQAMPVVKEMEDLVPPEYKGVALAYQPFAYVMAWNPTLIADDKVPSTIAELADPQWQGKFAFNSFFLTPIDILVPRIGLDAALELSKKIFANKPILEKGTPSVARAILTGAAQVGVTVSPVAEASERKKEPLKYKMLADYMPVVLSHVYVPENSPNPNTARLFAAWLVAEGSTIGDKFEPMSRPGDPATLLQKMVAAQTAKTGAKISSLLSAADIAAASKYRDAAALMLSGQTK